MSNGIGRGSFLYRFVRDFLGLLCKLFFRFEIHGAENLPETGSCIIASNHSSHLDPPLVGCVGKVKDRAVRFMARDTLYVPIFGAFLRKVHTIPLSRDKGDISALRTAIKAIKGGDLVSLFPEGTRSRDGEILEPKGGVAFLLSKSGVPLLPIYIDGSHAALPRGSIFIRPRKIRIYVGQLIDPAELKSDKKGAAGYKEVGAMVMQRIAALKPDTDSQN